MTEHIERFDPGKPLPILTHGQPFDEALARHLAGTLHRARPYLLVSGTLSRTTDAVERLTATLQRHGLAVAGVRRGMRPHTLYGDLVAILAELQTAGADALVVVGGGSLVDAAKALALALANGAATHDALDALFVASATAAKTEGTAAGSGTPGNTTTTTTTVHPSTIPCLCATTTLSGGEYTPFGSATDERTHRKRLFADPSPDAGHRVLVVDPRLAATVPPAVWLSTGMRAVDHAVETVCAAQPQPAATAAALAGLRQLVPALLRTRADPADVDARLQAQLGVAQTLKGIVLHGVQLGASHGIGHQLGPQGVPHAETTCVLLPAVLKYNARVNRAQQAVVLDALWDAPRVAAVLQDHGLHRATADLGDAMDAVIRALGLPRTLAAYGIGRDKLDGIAALSLTDWMCKTNPVPLVDKEQVLAILEQCLGEDKEQPLYDLGRSLDRGKLPLWQAMYKPGLDALLAALAAVGAEHADKHADDASFVPLSAAMRASWERGTYLVHFALHHSEWTDGLYHEVPALFPVVDPAAVAEEIRTYQKHTERQIAAYEQQRLSMRS